MTPERRKLIIIIGSVICAILLIYLVGVIYASSDGTIDGWRHPYQKPGKHKPTTTTTQSTTTTTKPPTTTIPTTTTSSSTTTTILITTTSTTIPGPTTSTTEAVNPSWWRPEWPNLSEGLVANVVHFGANPADDGGDDGPYIQNTIDWVAGEKPLSLVAPVSMPETWRIYYQFWEDVHHYQNTGVWDPTYDYDGQGSNFF